MDSRRWRHVESLLCLHLVPVTLCQAIKFSLVVFFPRTDLIQPMSTFFFSFFILSETIKVLMEEIKPTFTNVKFD